MQPTFADTPSSTIFTKGLGFTNDTFLCLPNGVREPTGDPRRGEAVGDMLFRTCLGSDNIGEGLLFPGVPGVSSFESLTGKQNKTSIDHEFHIW